MNMQEVCGKVCEVYSRVSGYYRPVSNWNKGKQEEFKDRTTYNATKSMGFRRHAVA